MLNGQLVEDVMHTAVVTVQESDDVARLRAVMHGAGIHHVPVLDDAQHVVGIVSARDLRPGVAPSARAGDVMVRDVITIRANASAAEASKIMAEYGFHSLPVVGDGEQIIGIVTRADLKRHAGA